MNCTVQAVLGVMDYAAVMIRLSWCAFTASLRAYIVTPVVHVGKGCDGAHYDGYSRQQRALRYSTETWQNPALVADTD